MENILKNYIQSIDEIYSTKMYELSDDIKKNKKEYIELREEFKGLKNLYTNLFNFKGIPDQYITLDVFLMMKNQALFPKGGTYRNTTALISGSNVKCSSPKEIRNDIDKLKPQFNNLKNKAKNVDNYEEYIKEVLLLKAEIVKIHPFVDGNGRCSRALVDYLFMLAGLEIKPYNKVDINEHKNYIDAMALIVEENNPEPLCNFYKQKINNFDNKVKRK
jgi:prophage maintenance system killer protein